MPEPAADNPLPIVLAKDGVVVLSYLAFSARRRTHVLVTFHRAFAHRLQPPGPATPPPPAAAGRRPETAYEIKNPSWARALGLAAGRHYAFAFRDAVFECLAEGYGSEVLDEDDDAVRQMARRLYK